MTPSEAAAIAAELDKANAERRWAEQKVIEAAERARPPSRRSGRGTGPRPRREGWHPGVVGIAASRMVERHFRPAVLISLEGGRGGLRPQHPGLRPDRRPGRLLGAPRASRRSSRGGRFRARARPARGIQGGVPGARRLRDRAGGPGPHRAARCPRRRGRDGIGMELAEQLESLGPFGMGNPGPRLLVPSGRLREVRPSARRASTPDFSSRAAPAGPSESPSG